MCEYSLSDKEQAQVLEFINQHDLHPLEAIKVVLGKVTLSEMLESKARDTAANALAKKPRKKWPLPKIVWDLDQSQWHLSMDDHSVESFRTQFSDVVLIWVEMIDLQANLAPQSKRTKDPISTDYKSRSASLVVHLQDGGKVSPPMIIYGGSGLIVIGGNHRLGWSYYTGEISIPILIRASERWMIEKLLVTKDEPITSS